MCCGLGLKINKVRSQLKNEVERRLNSELELPRRHETEPWKWR